MPEKNPSQLNDTKANALHEMEGPFTGSHLIFTKKSDGTIQVTFEVRKDGQKKSETLKEIPADQISKTFNKLDQDASREARATKPNWNPDHRLRGGYRITFNRNGVRSFSCGTIADEHTPKTFKQAKEALSQIVLIF